MLLGGGQLPQGHAVAQVAPGNTDDVGRIDDLVQLLQSPLVFDFCHDLPVLQTGLGHGPAQGVDVLRAPDKGLQNVGHAKAFGLGQIVQVRLGEGGSMDLPA